MAFPKFGKFLTVLYSNTFHSGTIIIWVLLSLRSLRLCSFSFSIFSFCCSYGVNNIDLFSCFWLCSLLSPLYCQVHSIKFCNSVIFSVLNFSLFFLILFFFAETFYFYFFSSIFVISYQSIFTMIALKFLLDISNIWFVVICCLSPFHIEIVLDLGIASNFLLYAGHSSYYVLKLFMIFKSVLPRYHTSHIGTENHVFYLASVDILRVRWLINIF